MEFSQDMVSETALQERLQNILMLSGNKPCDQNLEWAADAEPVGPNQATFACFTELPSELRLKIWTMTLLPRDVAIMSKKEVKTVGDRRVRNVKQFYSPNPSPPLLQVCQESRYEALKFYDRCFVGASAASVLALETVNWNCLGQPLVDPLGITCVYLSLQHDRIRLPEGLLAYVPARELSFLRRMVVEVADVYYFTHYNMSTIKACASLETLQLTIKPGEQTAWDYRSRDLLYRMIIDEFEDGLKNDTDWNMPSVMLYDASTENLVLGKVRKGDEYMDLGPFTN